MDVAIVSDGCLRGVDLVYTCSSFVYASLNALLCILNCTSSISCKICWLLVDHLLNSLWTRSGSITLYLSAHAILSNVGLFLFSKLSNRLIILLIHCFGAVWLFFHYLRLGFLGKHLILPVLSFILLLCCEWHPFPSGYGYNLRKDDVYWNIYSLLVIKKKIMQSLS